MYMAASRADARDVLMGVLSVVELVLWPQVE
jgi:hypothetical protein